MMQVKVFTSYKKDAFEGEVNTFLKTLVNPTVKLEVVYNHHGFCMVYVAFVTWQPVELEDEEII